MKEVFGRNICFTEVPVPQWRKKKNEPTHIDESKKFHFISWLAISPMGGVRREVPSFPRPKGCCPPKNQFCLTTSSMLRGSAQLNYVGRLVALKKVHSK